MLPSPIVAGVVGVSAVAVLPAVTGVAVARVEASQVKDCFFSVFENGRGNIHGGYTSFVYFSESSESMRESTSSYPPLP